MDGYSILDARHQDAYANQLKNVKWKVARKQGGAGPGRPFILHLDVIKIAAASQAKHGVDCKTCKVIFLNVKELGRQGCAGNVEEVGLEGSGIGATSP